MLRAWTPARDPLKEFLPGVQFLASERLRSLRRRFKIQVRKNQTEKDRLDFLTLVHIWFLLSWFLCIAVPPLSASKAIQNNSRTALRGNEARFFELLAKFRHFFLAQAAGDIEVHFEFLRTAVFFHVDRT